MKMWTDETEIGEPVVAKVYQFYVRIFAQSILVPFLFPLGILSRSDIENDSRQFTRPISNQPGSRKQIQPNVKLGASKIWRRGHLVPGFVLAMR